jgi:hypothetical protein
VLLGLLWAAWHVLPYAQAGHSLRWIAGQCLFTVALRVLMSWLYCNGGRSVFLVILCQVSSNLSFFVFPHRGSHYDPVIAGAVAAVAALIVAAATDPRTLRPR